MSMDKISFGERQLLRFARSKTTDPVPAVEVADGVGAPHPQRFLPGHGLTGEVAVRPVA